MNKELKVIKSERGTFIELPRKSMKFVSKEAELLFDSILENEELYEENKILTNDNKKLKEQNSALVESLSLAKHKYKTDKVRYRRKTKVYSTRIKRAEEKIISWGEVLHPSFQEEMLKILRGEE